MTKEITFEDLDLCDPILNGLWDMGFRKPTPIQTQAIPIILKGQDIIACAQTGTGKTGAFLIPTMSMIEEFSEDDGQVKALILVPTRELAGQIDAQAEGFSFHSTVSSIPVYGGNKGGDSWSIQRAALEKGADIVISTPGRLIQHLTLGYVDLSGVQYFILDEADRMLDMGFYQDLMRIASYLPEDRQTLMFSATMPPKIRSLAREIMKPKPAEISIAVSKPAEGVDQKAYMTFGPQKIPLLEHIMKEEEVHSMIIFASRKTSVDQIEKTLRKLGMDVRGMHSDRDQGEREEIMNQFANHQVKILVATDILSRGIDVDNISHIVNFDVPQDAEDYVHRVGRTARAETTGKAFTFISPDDIHRFARIERLIGSEVPKLDLPEGLGDAPVYAPRKKGGKGQGGSGRSGKGRGGNKRNFRNKKSGGGGANKGPRNQQGGGEGKSQGGGNRRNNKRRGGGKNRNQGPKPATNKD